MFISVISQNSKHMLFITTWWCSVLSSQPGGGGVLSSQHLGVSAGHDIGRMVDVSQGLTTLTTKSVSPFSE